jgi:hypothetical protein
MSIEALIQSSGVRRVVLGLLESVRIGVRSFWRGGDHANAPARRAHGILNRLARLLRLAILIAAAQLTLAPTKARTTLRISRPHTWRPPKARFRVFARYRVTYDDTPAQPQPEAFAHAERDPVLSAERKRAAILDVLADPASIVRRIARRLPTRLMVFGWRPPKRRPPHWPVDFWHELRDAYHEARYQIREFRRRMRDMAEGAPA